MCPIRVLIADDHPLVRSGIRNELVRHESIEVVAEALDGDQAWLLSQELQPDILLLDLNMPGMKAVQVLRQMRSLPNAPKVLILTAYGDEENVLGMLKAGVVGYILKDEEPRVIIEAIETVIGGETWLSPAVLETLVSHVSSGVDTSEEELSQREHEVLDLLSRGLSNAQIADDLNITERTVRFHVENILSKLRVNNRTEAAILALQRGLTGSRP